MTAIPRYADACPSCPPGDYPAVAPASVTREVAGSDRASYRHEACGHEWNCWWDPEYAGWPAHLPASYPEPERGEAA